MRYLRTIKNFFNKKGESKLDEINLQDIYLHIKDSLIHVKDLGFTIKIVNYSFTPITLKNLSLDITITPDTGKYDFTEFISEVKDSIAHISQDDMDVKMYFNFNLKSVNLVDIYLIHRMTSDLYEYEVLGSFLNDIDNFTKVIENDDIDVETRELLKKNIIVKLDITGQY
jgi:hypothetical protein